MKRLFWAVLLPAACAVAGCGGAGGGGSVTVSPTAAPTTTASSTPAITVSGTVVEYTSRAALGGFTVTIGQVPDASTCLNAESNTSMPCGVPAAPVTTAATGSNGAFSLTVPRSGTYMLTIGKDTTYATLHRTITAGASSLALGTLGVAALSADEQAWLVDVNHQRATVSFPVSFSNLVVDEYAEEQARAEVAAIVNGTDPYGDPTEELFSGYYAASPGAMYGASGVADLIGAAGAYLQADANWMSEKANCPNGNWETCPFLDNTGHYINISETASVWIGMGESSVSYVHAPYGNQWAYAMLIPTQ